LAKSDRTTGVDPETGQMVSLFDPRTDAWDEHFRWQDSPRVIVGLTPRVQQRRSRRYFRPKVARAIELNSCCPAEKTADMDL
jgi:hypothetical protein